MINGDLDLCRPPARGHLVAELTGDELVVLDRRGHTFPPPATPST